MTRRVHICDLFTFGYTNPNITLAATNDAAAMIFQAPRAGSITRIHARCNSITGAPVCQGSLQTVSARRPSGTIMAGGAAWGNTTMVGGAWNTFTFGTPATVTAGLVCAANVSWASGATSAVVDYGRGGGAPMQNYNLPCALSRAAGTWTVRNTAAPAIEVEYSDGYLYNPNLWTTTESAWNSGATPYRGLWWRPRISTRIQGFWCFFRPGTASQTFQGHVFQGNATAPAVSTPVINPNTDIAVDSVGMIYLSLPPVWVRANKVCRLVVQALTVTSFTTAYYAVFRGTASAAAYHNGEFQMCRATTPGTWTDTVLQMPLICPDIIEVDPADTPRDEFGPRQGWR